MSTQPGNHNRREAEVIGSAPGQGSLRGRLAFLVLVSVVCSYGMSVGYLVCMTLATLISFTLRYGGLNWWHSGFAASASKLSFNFNSTSWIENDWFWHIRYAWASQEYVSGGVRTLLAQEIGIAPLTNAATFGVAFLLMALLCWMVPLTRPGVRSLWRRPGRLSLRRTAGWAVLLGAGWAMCSHELDVALGTLEVQLSLPLLAAVVFATILGAGSALGAVLGRLTWLAAGGTNCTLCGYELAGITAESCPECGEPRRQQEIGPAASLAGARFQKLRRAVVVGVLVAIALACFRVGSCVNYLRQREARVLGAEFQISRQVLVESRNNGAWLLRFAIDSAAIAAEPQRFQDGELPLVVTATRMDGGVPGETMTFRHWLMSSREPVQQYVGTLRLSVGVNRALAREEIIAMRVFDQGVITTPP